MTSYYKKQVEIAREFGVSEGTVTNWIKSAEESKNKLQLIEIKGKQKIIKNEHNRVTMLNLADSGKKFRPDDDVVELVVKDDIYNILSQNQLISLINSIRVYRSIPQKFSFLGKGADLWQDFYQKIVLDDSIKYGTSNSDLYFLESLYKYVIDSLDDSTYVNVIDIGPGGESPIFGFAEKALQQGKLKNYCAIDISERMLELTGANLKKTTLSPHYKSFILDIESQSPQDVLYGLKDYTGRENVSNLIFFVGGTIGNFDSDIKILQNIKDGMCPDDILIITNALDSVKNRTSFPALSDPESLYSKQIRYISDLLCLDEQYFSRELIYNEKTTYRECNLILNSNVQINFKNFNSQVTLSKGEKINIWKHKRDTFELISDNIANSKLKLQWIVKHPKENNLMYVSKTDNLN
jgi:uncharacterized SAM-dependent methyltransferase